jgi:crotonobetainyl-CoA:carnitine CoA-transferase CaiB-like acyl-CoA transferase
MLGAIVSTFAYLASDHLATGKLPVPTGNDHPIAAPYGMLGPSKLAPPRLIGTIAPCKSLPATS